ncbi:GAF domain-containing protein [Arthrobacter sp. D1-17]
MAEASPSNLGPGFQAAFPVAVLATPDVENFLRDALHEFAYSIGNESRDVLWAVSLVGGETVRTWVSGSPDARRVDALHGSFDDGPLRAAVRSGEFVHIADVATERRWPGYATFLAGHGAASLLTVPLMVGGEIGAALTLYAPIPHAFTSDDIAGAAACARRIAADIHLLLQLAQRAEATAVESPLSLVDLAVWSLMREYGLSRDNAAQYLQEVVQNRVSGPPGAGITAVLPTSGLAADGGLAHDDGSRPVANATAKRRRAAGRKS